MPANRTDWQSVDILTDLLDLQAGVRREGAPTHTTANVAKMAATPIKGRIGMYRIHQDSYLRCM